MEIPIYIYTYIILTRIYIYIEILYPSETIAIEFTYENQLNLANYGPPTLMDRSWPFSKSECKQLAAIMGVLYSYD